MGSRVPVRTFMDWNEPGARYLISGVPRMPEALSEVPLTRSTVA